MRPLTLWITRPGEDEARPLRMAEEHASLVHLGEKGDVEILPAGDGIGRARARGVRPGGFDVVFLPVDDAWMAIAMGSMDPMDPMDPMDSMDSGSTERAFLGEISLMPGVPHLVRDRDALTWGDSGSMITFSHEGPVVIEPAAADDRRPCLLCTRPLFEAAPGAPEGAERRVATCPCGAAYHAEDLAESGKCIACGREASDRYRWWPLY